MVGHFRANDVVVIERGIRPLADLAAGFGDVVEKGGDAHGERPAVLGRVVERAKIVFPHHENVVLILGDADAFLLLGNDVLQESEAVEEFDAILGVFGHEEFREFIPNALLGDGLKRARMLADGIGRFLLDGKAEFSRQARGPKHAKRIF